jgi:hypothetical protein
MRLYHCFIPFVAFFIETVFFKTKMIYSTEQKAFMMEIIFSTVVRSTMSCPIHCNIVCKSFNFSCHKLALINNFVIRKRSGGKTKRTPEIDDAVEIVENESRTFLRNNNRKKITSTMNKICTSSFIPYFYKV